MKLFKGYLAALGSAMTCAGILGLAATRYSTLHLLAKNRALLAAGRVALPGSGHLETMAAWSPALAGGLFFALVLGFGYGSFAYFYGLSWRFIPRRYWTMAATPFAILPFMALYRNEWNMYLALTFISAFAVIFALKTQLETTAFSRKALVTPLAAFFLIALGFLPWLALKQGPFVKVRDAYLLDSSLLRPLNDFYYRWTLYPAEAIKPLDLSTQPGAAVEEGLRDRFCPEAWSLGIVCMPKDAPSYDFVVKAEGDRILLAAKESKMYWKPGDTEANGEYFKIFADGADPSRILRRTTSISLFILTPLTLLILLAWAVRSVAGKPATVLGAAAVLAVIIGYMGMPDRADALRYRLFSGEGTREEILAALKDADPALRFYGAKAAGADPRGYPTELMRALDDEVVNVRYSAATALGGLDTPESRTRLMAVVAGTDYWYVKYRAYNSLAKLGWLP